MEKSYELNDWMERHKDLHLTVGDLRRLKGGGDELEVILFDRAYIKEYGIWNNLKEDRPYDPPEFFQGNRARLVYNGEKAKSWNIHFEFAEVYEHPMHINVERTVWRFGLIWERMAVYISAITSKI